ncbi:hypothetical protein TNCV_4807141 [Trichonephila clavipes]|nr:hypothetical protein TNCV_4807141 [Trichonephila clavipes]
MGRNGEHLRPLAKSVFAPKFGFIKDTWWQSGFRSSKTLPLPPRCGDVRFATNSWIEQDSRCVLFSDESRFSTQRDSWRVFLWRELRKLYQSANIREIDRFGDPSPFHNLSAGTVIVERYTQGRVMILFKLYQKEQSHDSKRTPPCPQKDPPTHHLAIAQ